MAYVKQCSGCGEGQDCCSNDAKWGYWTDNVYSDQPPFELITPSEWVFYPTLYYLTLKSTCGVFNGQDRNRYDVTVVLNYDIENCWYSDANGTMVFKKATAQEIIDSGTPATALDEHEKFCVYLNSNLANDDLGDIQQNHSNAFLGFKIQLKANIPTNDFTIGSNFNNFAWVSHLNKSENDDAGMAYSCP